MSMLNSTRLLSALVIASCLPTLAQAAVTPKARQRVLKEAQATLQQTCERWSGEVRQSWLLVEEVGGLSCMKDSRIPPAAERLVRQDFIQACVADLGRRLGTEIDRHPKALRDYTLPTVETEEILALYARSLYPTYQQFCADGPLPAIGVPAKLQEGEFVL